MNTDTLAVNLALSGHSSNKQRIETYPSHVSIILKLLAQLKHGALHLQLPDGSSAHFGDDSYPVTLRLNSWTIFGAVMKSGDIGFAETPFMPESQDAASLEEALRQMRAKHGLTRLQIAILADDAAKRALVESLGFQKEGVLRGQFFWQGTQRDLVCLAHVER